MKVALCISGQPRNAYRGIENILQNIESSGVGSADELNKLIHLQMEGSIG